MDIYCLYLESLCIENIYMRMFPDVNTFLASMSSFSLCIFREGIAMLITNFNIWVAIISYQASLLVLKPEVSPILRCWMHSLTASLVIFTCAFPWLCWETESYFSTHISISSVNSLVPGRCDCNFNTQLRIMSFGVQMLKGKCCHFDEIFITGCTGSCQNDNFPCSQWWKFHQNDDNFQCSQWWKFHKNIDISVSVKMTWNHRNAEKFGRKYI